MTKNNENLRLGRKVAGASILVSCLLCVGNLWIGYATGSTSVLADEQVNDEEQSESAPRAKSCRGQHTSELSALRREPMDRIRDRIDFCCGCRLRVFGRCPSVGSCPRGHDSRGKAPRCRSSVRTWTNRNSGWLECRDHFGRRWCRHLLSITADDLDSTSSTGPVCDMAIARCHRHKNRSEERRVGKGPEDWERLACSGRMEIG